MPEDLGASASGSGSHASHEAPAGLRPSGFDPSRGFYADNDFMRGAQACREMMARFVEQGGDTSTAASIRANWHPAWGEDPGAPPSVIDTWEAPECPEGEALYADYCAAVANDADHQPDVSPKGLNSVATMMERWAIPMFPANRYGQIPFVRGLIESAVRHLREASMIKRITVTEDEARRLFLDHCDVGPNNALQRYGEAPAVRAILALASGMSAGTAETAQQAQGEARQPDPKGDAQP